MEQELDTLRSELALKRRGAAARPTR
jgi:hypothetical protein